MMRRMIVPAAALFLAWAAPAIGQSTHTVWWTTDAAKCFLNPCLNHDWNQLTTPPPSSLLEGQVIWFGVCNVERHEVNKFLTIIFATPHVGQITVKAEGFMGDTAGALNAVTVTTLEDSLLPDPPRHKISYRFSPHQPRWERFTLKATKDLAGLAWDATANSSCMLAEWDIPYVEISAARFGALGAMEGNPLVTEVWLFPRTGSVNLELPTHSFPPGTGVWGSAFVYTDPFGDPRPGGGVKFSTLGTGMSVTDSCDFRVRIDGGNVRDYDIYAYDASVGGYSRYFIRIANVLPVSGPAALWTLSLAVATLGAAFLRRRFRRRPVDPAGAS